MTDTAHEPLLLQRICTVANAFVVFGLLSIFFLSDASAQTNPARQDVDSAGLFVDASAGLGGIVDRSTPVPVSFLFRNDSGRNIEGVLTLTDLLNGQSVTLGEITIAPGTARKFTSIQSMPDWFDCFAELKHNDKVLWRRELDLSTNNRFDRSVNFILFVDNDGRRLSLPGNLTESVGNAMQEPNVSGPAGRPIHTLTVKPWQISNHPGPLFVAQAMIFPDGASERDLNQVQWKAVAEWMCQGGSVFVHASSREIINRLVESAPLATEPAIQTGLLVVRRIGLGAIHEYTEPLLSSNSNELQQTIAQTAACLNRNQINAFADSGTAYYMMQPGRADRNRSIVVAFFCFYTFVSGVVALLLFRLSQKRMAAFIVIVVVSASAMAGVLGGVLRISRGDLNWLTVTQAGVGGLVQVGNIDVQSAGSRNTRVAIKGEHVDLQCIKKMEYYFYGTPQQMGYSPFTWQPNLMASEEDICQINLPMSPWGRRRCHATAFKRDIQPMDFELEFEPQNPVSQNESSPQSSAMPAGTISLKLVNRLPFHLQDCWLVVGTTTNSTQPPALPQLNQPLRANFRGQPRRPWNVPVEGLIDVYHTQRLQDILSGARCEIKVGASFQFAQDNWEMATLWPNGSKIPPRISRLGMASAWIIGRAMTSPVFQIDEKRGDFDENQHAHLFVQEIFPEDMPDTLKFHGTAKGLTPGSETSAPR